MAPKSKAQKAQRSKKSVKSKSPAVELVVRLPLAPQSMKSLNAQAIEALGSNAITPSTGLAKASSKFTKREGGFTQQLTLFSEQPFSLTPMVISQGIFKGRQILLLDPEPVASDSFRFMDLPPEIRNMIYNCALSSQNHAVHLTGSRQNTLAAYWENSRGVYSRVSGSTGIVTTCRQVYEESVPILYGGNDFEFRCTTTLSIFMTGIGSAAQYLRKIPVDRCVYSSMRKAMRLLEKATSLESFHFKVYKWSTRDDDMYQHYYRESLPYWLASHFKLLLLLLQTTRNDREAVFGILRFDELEGKCLHCRAFNATAEATCKCDSKKDDYATWLEDLKTRVFKYLVDVDTENFAGLQVPEGHVVLTTDDEDGAEGETVAGPDDDDDDDDFSYLESAPAPSRRNTGRPKRSTGKDISYADM